MARSYGREKQELTDMNGGLYFALAPFVLSNFQFLYGDEFSAVHSTPCKITSVAHARASEGLPLLDGS